MNIIQRIAKNTSALFIGQFIVSLSTIVLAIAIARSLGDVVFGKFSFALAFVSFYALFSELGYDTLLIRDVARNKSLAGKYLNNIMSIRALLSFTVYVFIVVSINVMDYPADTKSVVYLFGIYMLLVSLSNVFKVTFRAFEKMEYEAGITTFVNVVRVFSALLVLFFGYGLTGLGLVFLFSGVLDFVLSFIICEKKFVKSKTEFDIDFLKSTIKVAVPIGLLSMFALVYVRIDTIMLSAMKGDAVVGWYNAAYNLVRGFKPFPHIFMTAILPLISYYFVSSKKSLKIAYEKSFKYLFILGLPLAVGITLLADQFILLFYGEQFVNSIIALQILSWDIFLIFLYACSAFILISIDKQNKMAVIAGSAALMNIVLNIFLIPSYSYVGAAIATVVTESFLLVSYLYLNSRTLHMLPVNRHTAKPIFACAAMGFFIYLFNEINLVLLVVLAILIYFGLLFFTKGFSKEDISLFKNLIKRKS